MLLLTRRDGDWVRLRCQGIGADVWVGVIWQDGRFKLAFEAPPGVEIMRDELLPPAERHRDERGPQR